mgnify:CR=1 FL=1
MIEYKQKSNLHEFVTAKTRRDLLDLTKQELLNLLELAHDALSVDTDQELHDLLLRVPKLVPCEYIISMLGQTDQDGHLQGVAKLVNVSYSAGWLANYLESGYATTDPVLLTHFRFYKPQLWSKTFQQATSKDEQKFIEHAKSYSLSEGITLGRRSRRNSTGSLFSFAGQNMGEHPRHGTVLAYLAPHLHVALMRTAFSVSEFPPLTTREQEVLQWMIKGKTNWETSQVLDISERTVKFHVHNILEKLHSSTRGHAIAQAMEQGLVGVSSSSLETWLASLCSEAGISPNRGLPRPIRPQPVEAL